jgi:hypothetical protein
MIDDMFLHQQASCLSKMFINPKTISLKGTLCTLKVFDFAMK